MKPIVKLSAFVLLMGLLFHISCKREISCENCKTNKPPIANAGPDGAITLPTDSALLDGSASSDPDGKISSYLWAKIAGPASFTISNEKAAPTVVKNLAAGVYRFELKVTDDGGLHAKDTVQVIVDDPAVNQPPIANAGTDETITLPTDSVSLNGNQSLDPDGIITSWQWSKISGPSSFTVITPNIVQTTVSGLVQGVYKMELKVTDNGGLIAKDTVQIMVNNAAKSDRPPVANAGGDQTITLPTNTTTLNGSGSSDPDNNITSYAWTKISGPPSFSIVNPNLVQIQITNLTQGSYQFELKVTDAGGLFAKDTLYVCVFNLVIGQEIIYDGGWGCNDLCRDGDVYWTSEQAECNPYADTSIALQVSIRLDTSSAWIDVRKYNSPLPSVNQFYWQVDRGYLWVFAFEGRLIGTQVTVRVIFF